MVAKKFLATDIEMADASCTNASRTGPFKGSKKTDEGRTILENLIVLGFNIKEMETIHRTTFTPTMFDCSNQKAFEVVTYFLFSKLDPETTKSLFRFCYPVKIAQEISEFRNIAFRHFQSLFAEERKFFQNLHFQKSVLVIPGGRRFIQFMHQFSAYVLYKVLSKNGHVIKPLPMPASNCILSARCLVLKNRLCDSFSSCKELQSWSATANQRFEEEMQNITERYKKALERKEQAQKELKELVSDSAENEGVVSQTVSVMDSLHQHLNRQEELWQTFGPAFQHKKPTLKASDIPLDWVPSDVEEKFSLYNEKGHLDLINFVKLQNFYLKMYASHIQELTGSLKSVTENLPNYKKVLDCSSQILQKTAEVRNVAENCVSEVSEEYHKVNEKMKMMPLPSHVKEELKVKLPSSPQLSFSPLLKAPSRRSLELQSRFGFSFLDSFSSVEEHKCDPETNEE